MILTEKLLREFEGLSDERKREVLDFIEFVKQREEREMEILMETIIAENRKALQELARQ
jgi:hypothetical protein